MRWRTPPTQRGFTLVEMLATTVVLAVICLGTVTLTSSAARAYANASSSRRAAEQVAMALDRINRVIRECPGKATELEQPNISAASASSITFGDGTVVALNGSVLKLTTPTAAASPLCNGVTSFQMTYLGTDGSTLNIGAGNTTDQIACVQVRLAAQGIDLRTSAFLRTVIAN